MQLNFFSAFYSWFATLDKKPKGTVANKSGSGLQPQM